MGRQNMGGPTHVRVINGVTYKFYPFLTSFKQGGSWYLARQTQRSGSFFMNTEFLEKDGSWGAGSELMRFESAREALLQIVWIK